MKIDKLKRGKSIRGVAGKLVKPLLWGCFIGAIKAKDDIQEIFLKIDFQSSDKPGKL